MQRVLSGAVKISELPAASAARSTDEFEVNQSGISRRVTLAQIAAGKPIDVRDFGVTLDGSTDDTADVAAAVAAAAASGQALYWPPGTALTTQSIPLLHTVQHRGPGKIKRGADVFTLAPRGTSTNHLYVSPAGDVAADGLSSSQPTTPQAAATALSNYGPVLQGTWQIDFAAGDHAGLVFARALQGNIRLVGVPTGDFTSRPTTKITKAASGSREGIYAVGAGKVILIKDIETYGFNGSTPIESGTRAEYFVNITFENHWAVSCFRGRFFEVFTEHNSKGGVIDDCYWGTSELFGVVRNYQYAGSKANATIIRNCTTGQHQKELCTGHNDYLRIEDCDQGCLFTRCATANLSNMDFRRNTIGAIVGPGSAVINNLSINWNGQPVTSASWVANVVTFNFALDALGRGVNVLAGETFKITGASPSAYDGTYTALTVSDTQLTAVLMSDPGSWVSGGRSNANAIEILPWNPSILLQQDGPGGNVEDVVETPYVGMVEKVKSHVLKPATLTGTTSLTAIFFPIPGFQAGEFQAEGYHVRLYAAGTYNIASANATLNFRANTTNLEVYTLPTGTHAWVMEAMFVITATGDVQVHSGTLAVDGQSVQVKTGTRTLAFSTIEYAFGVWGQLTDAADSITASFAQIYTTCL